MDTCAGCNTPISNPASEGLWFPHNYGIVVYVLCGPCSTSAARGDADMRRAIDGNLRRRYGTAFRGVRY